MLIWTNCDGGVHVRTETKGRFCFNIKNKCCAVVPQITTQLSHSGKAASSLQAILLTLSLLQSFLPLCTPSSGKGNGMACLLWGQTVKMKTKHHNATVLIHGQWRNEFPSLYRREYKIQRSLVYSANKGSVPSLVMAFIQAQMVPAYQRWRQPDISTLQLESRP